MAETVELIGVEELVANKVARERARLEQEAGIAGNAVNHFKRPVEKPFTKDQRPHTTLLFGGLTWKHENLIQTVHGVGYKFVT
jgi:hypothetical protein